MRTYILLSILLVSSFSIIAQVDSPTSYSSYFTLSASRYEPGNLGEDHERFEIALINAYAWFGNTSLDAQSLSDLRGHFNGETLSDSDLDAVLDKMGSKNRIGAGATIDYLNAMYKITNSEGDEIITVGIGMADRVEGNIIFPNNIFPLLIRGNKQYEDETVDLSLGGSFFYTREHTISAAMPLPISSEDWHFRAGARLKYIKGIEAMYTETGDYSLYTAPQGKYLDFNYDYTFHSSLDYRSDSDYSFKPFSGKGTGYGADLGISATFKDRWHGNINILDLGSVNFSSPENLTYKKSGTFRYEGLVYDDIIDENNLNTDSLIQAIEDELTDGNEFEGQDFSMPYPTRLRMHLSYRVPAENKKGHTYYPHIIGLNIIQGFRDIGNATTRTYAAGSYTFNLHDTFEVGTNIGVFGYNKLEFGAFMALKAGFFRFGFGSGNITPLVRSFGTGLDFNFNMTLAFN